MEEEHGTPGARWGSRDDNDSPATSSAPASPPAPAATTTPAVPKAGAIPPPSDPFRMWTVVLGVLLAVALIVTVVGLIMATGDSDSHSSSYSSYSRYSDTTTDDGTGAGWWVFSGGLGSVGALLPCLLLSMIGTQVWSIRAGVRPKGLAPVTV